MSRREGRRCARRICSCGGRSSAERGWVRWLDLGGIATDRSPGIARFKLGMGGEVAILPGTFLVRRIARHDRPGS